MQSRLGRRRVGTEVVRTVAQCSARGATLHIPAHPPAALGAAPYFRFASFEEFATEPTKKGPKFFIIGVWSQPTYNFDKWKQRGINTLMKYEGLSGSVSLDNWIAAANSKGLYQIREERDDPSLDKNEKLLLAWTANDEPDIYSQYHAALKPDYEYFKAADPDRPVVINFAGSMVNGWHATPLKRQDYETMLPYMDWVSNGVYPVTGWDRPEHLDGPGRALDRLQKWSDGKPQLQIIESGDQQLTWNPARLRSEIGRASCRERV